MINLRHLFVRPRDDFVCEVTRRDHYFVDPNDLFVSTNVRVNVSRCSPGLSLVRELDALGDDRYAFGFERASFPILSWVVVSHPEGIVVSYYDQGAIVVVGFNDFVRVCPREVYISRTRVGLTVRRLSNRRDESMRSGREQLFLGCSIGRLPLYFRFSGDLLVFVFRMVKAHRVSVCRRFIPRDHSFGLGYLRVLFSYFFHVSHRGVQLSLHSV